LGLPVVGQTLGLLRALRGNTAEAWLQRRASTYGPVSKLSLFGLPTAFLVGPSANKFFFASAALTTKTTTSFNRMVGWRNIRELAGDDHRRVRAMMVQFLKLEAVRSYVAAMDDEVRHHLREEWSGHATVSVMPSMKSLTFDTMCTVLFGLRRADHGAVMRELCVEFQLLVRGIWAIPVDLPFTTFGKCLAASRRGRRTVARIIDEKRTRLGRGASSPSDDLMTHMLSEGLADEDIIDSVMILMVAAHDSTATLVTFLMRYLDGNRDAYAKVVAEQQEVARSKAPGEALSWEDLGKMKYTWSAAMETLRLVPPVFGNFKRAVDDVEFDGHLIPKGWQVLTAASMTQLDPAIFQDPGRFEPARFDNPIPPYNFVAFGGGARVCPGNEFARVEALVAMHYIVTGFRWKLAAGCDGSFSRHPLPSPAQGLLIDIEPIEATFTEIAYGLIMQLPDWKTR
jgi:cytochrome P450